MAKTNKYASLNFNDIYGKKAINSHNPSANTHSSSPSPSPSSSSSSFSHSSKTIISNSRIHGHMIVLTRPTPKPISTHQPASAPPSQTAPSQPQQPEQQQPDQTRLETDFISLRPLGRTGSALPPPSSPLSSPKPAKDLSPLSSPFPKTDRFVPPHLRPGFVGREEKPEPGVKSREIGGRRQGQYGSPNRYGEEGRPKSGGGHERMRNRGESDLEDVSRPGSSG